MESPIIFFSHCACRYYPCHVCDFPLNCLFCFCPLYAQPSCPGAPLWLEGRVKDCSRCLFPHLQSHYHLVLAASRSETL